MTLGGCDFELAGSGSQGMTPDTCDGEGEGLTGPGATTCRRENASATSATKKTRAAARESSRTIERRARGWGAAIRDLDPNGQRRRRLRAPLEGRGERAR